MSETESIPKKKMGTGGKIALGCLGLFIVGVIISTMLVGAGISGVAKVAEEVSNNIEESEEADLEAFENPHELNDEVTVDKVLWIVTKAEALGSTLASTYGEYGDDCVANSGSFVKVTVRVKNNSKEMVSVTGLNLYDSEMREYITSSDVFSCVEDDLFILENVNPGIEKTFVAIYEIPEDAEDLRLKVGDLDFFTDGKDYVSLGF